MHQDPHLHVLSTCSCHPCFQPSFHLLSLSQTVTHSAETPWALPQTMDDLTLSSSTSQTQSHSWEYGEMRDFITIWGEEEIPHHLQKGHGSRSALK